MSAEFWTETARMTTAGLLVAAVAVPVGLLARLLRPRGEPLLPPWEPWRVPWTAPWGEVVVIAFFLVQLMCPSLFVVSLDRAGFYRAVYGPDFPAIDAKDGEANTLRMLWANVLAVPVLLGLLAGALRARYPKWKPAALGNGSFAGKVWLAVLAWLVLTPTVLTVHAAVNEISKALGTEPEQHALTKLANRPALDRVLFVLEACIGAPLREEVLFRGLMLAWCVGRIRTHERELKWLTDARPVFVMGVAVAFAVLGRNPASIAFAAFLVVGLKVLWRFKHTGARRARAVYATAAFFALMHSTWPNPLPLFVFGLGLGWLAVRTNGLLVPVVVHGLFNAVSTVFLFRGAG